MKRLDDPLTAAIRGIDHDGVLDERAVERVRAATYAAVRRELDAVDAQREQAPLWPTEEAA